MIGAATVVQRRRGRCAHAKGPTYVTELLAWGARFDRDSDGNPALAREAAQLRREESRGGHFRSDFPNRDDIKWRKHVADRLEPES